uniref:Uncharacterized protein n=1 Tax=Skeletonema marinoi TaxID=267567 RepID=A0A7S2L3Z1_9STRA|mmetsp:Transcript_19886/g.33626  ORF Transcript_19886/g.33626 Transcript_19886/m.33626 type:complete len:198 (+) Transcript_19886:151-744(+)
MAEAGQEISGEVLREVELKIDIRSATILVIPKSDEIQDKNMPRNLHNAAELFLRVGMVDAAENVKRNVADLLDIYSNDPDGKSNFHVGRGVVCWACGHCGIPKGGANQKGNNIKDDLDKITPGPCNKCGETEQVNWLKVTQPVDATNTKKEELPWIETPPLSEEEMKKKKEAQLLAKRKEVEEQVKRALEERERKNL